MADYGPWVNHGWVRKKITTEFTDKHGWGRRPWAQGEGWNEGELREL